MELRINEEKLSGYVESIVYRNDENGYTVLTLDSEGKQSSVVGCFHYINVGEYVNLVGEYTNHYIYGEQFKARECEISIPSETAALERYLGSGAIKGIGASLAHRIVEMFGEDTLDVLENQPECLSKVKGISAKKAQEIAVTYNEKREFRHAMMFLQQYGISINLSGKIYDYYNDEVYGIIRENPYQLAEEIPGVGFKTADEIAAKVGIRPDSEYRIKSGIQYVLTIALGDGHTYLPDYELKAKACELLDTYEGVVERLLEELAISRKIVIDSRDYEEFNRVYLIKYYYMELSVAEKLRQLSVSYRIDSELLSERIKQVENESGIFLDDEQKQAVKGSFENGVLVITGGPGTGKTTTINTILRCFQEENLEIALAAPTGRAAKRMTESCGYEAKTIHRLLEVCVNSGIDENMERATFARNEENPIDADVIIVDEVSMVDIFLMTSLLKAIVPGTRLIFVGDANQLPSVGPGSVLRDIIDSKVYKVVTLDKIFRQSMESDIVVNAHRINNKEEIILDNKSKDFFFLKRYDADIVVEAILYLVTKKLPPYLGVEPTDIQVLCPMKKGPAGVENMNRVLQATVNPPSENKREHDFGDKIFREGDKVMQVKNNYQLEWTVLGKYNLPVKTGTGVFNGDVGIIKAVNKFAEVITVIYDDNKEVDYTYKMSEELELAYAVTIHKSQGSEYPAVIIPLLGGSTMLFNKNLIYTAVTRAKNLVTIVGDEKVFYRMIENDKEKVRYSGLRDRIIETEERDIFGG